MNKAAFIQVTKFLQARPLVVFLLIAVIASVGASFIQTPPSQELFDKFTPAHCHEVDYQTIICSLN